MSRLLSTLGGLLGAALVGLLVIPLLALAASSSVADVQTGLAHPAFGAALALSLRTTATSLALTLVLGTPLAWWLAFTDSRARAPVQALTALPLVLPPTVLGFYLLVFMSPGS